MLLTCLTFAGLTTAFYFVFREASLPVQMITVSTSSFMDSSDKSIPEINAIITDEELTFGLGFGVCAAAFASLLGWFFFVLCGGVGMAALPLDFILAFAHRPRLRDAKNLVLRKMEMKEKAKELRETLNKLDGIPRLMWSHS